MKPPCLPVPVIEMERELPVRLPAGMHRRSHFGSGG